jgi:hypothetical protein
VNDAVRDLIEHKRQAADLCRARTMVSSAWTLARDAGVDVDAEAKALRDALCDALHGRGWETESSEWDFRASIARHRREAKP